MIKSCPQQAIYSEAGELHDQLEEALPLLLALGHRQQPEATPSPPPSPPDDEARGDRRLEQVDSANAGGEALVPLGPPNAADSHGVRRLVALRMVLPFCWRQN